MKYLIIAALIIAATLPVNAAETINRSIDIIYVQPLGETFTEDEQQQAYQNVLASAAYWQDLSPITTTLSIASTQLITTEYDVLSDPGMVLQLDSVHVSYANLPLVVIDNSNSGRYIYDNSVGIASYAAIYVISSAGAATYAHEYGHAFYNLPHQYQSAYDIMGLDPYPAYQRHTIGCASLAVLGKPCTQIFIPIVNNPAD